ncbi:hypothetical protein M8C13_23150 [Crossiella sp. SN42]|uniref:hypothetical protein n=1 Tax=Crossiella sp. SN42 TaxID=2944808 RepID=UPI00207CFB2C|nr:hypothetical protein [Crossiella sp. SN42]MCO1578655.1 hypothetical protein [Crossiella sp. SN42]
MTDLDCYVEALATGTLLGIDRHWGPAQVDALLGGEGHDGLNVDAHNWWRDYGLAEIFWQRGSLAHHWRGHHFSLQLHRLPHDWCTPNEMLRARYGEFRPRTSFTDLQAALAERDIPLVEVPRHDEDYREYRQPSSGATVLVVNHHPDPDPDYPTLAFGDLYRIGSAPALPHLDRPRWEALGQALTPVPALSPPERAAWLTEHEPTGPDQSAWWHGVLTHLSDLDKPFEPAQAPLLRWFLHESLSRPAPVIAVALDWLEDLRDTSSPLANATQRATNSAAPTATSAPLRPDSTAAITTSAPPPPGSTVPTATNTPPVPGNAPSAPGSTPPTPGSTPPPLDATPPTLASTAPLADDARPATATASALPTADDIVRLALSAAPLSPAQTRWADPGVRGPDLPAQLLTRDLIAAAARQRRHLTSPDLREQLLPWLELWPELR